MSLCQTRIEDCKVACSASMIAGPQQFLAAGACTKLLTTFRYVRHSGSQRAGLPLGSALE
jgi:hypothetical protein